MRVGVLVVAATVLFALLLFRLSGDGGLLGGQVDLRTRFETIQGLSEGAEVRFKGVTVGAVHSIDFAEGLDEDDIVVRFGVRRDVAARLDRHVIAELKASSPLGDKLLELRRPSDVAPGPALEEGSFVPSVPPFELRDVTDVGTDLLGDVRSIARSLDVITTRLVAGEGLFGRLLKDREFGERTLTDLERVIARLREIVEDSADGRNLIGALVGDEELARQVTSDLEATLADLRTVSARIESGEGALGRLTSEDAEIEQAIDDFTAAAASMRAFGERLESAEGGLLTRLLFDEEYGRRTAGHLEELLAHAAGVAAKLDEGEGTAGALVNDRGVYEGLDNIVSGIERSWFISFILKRKQKKGYQDQVDRILARSPNPDEELLALLVEILEIERAEAAKALGLEAPPEEATP